MPTWPKHPNGVPRLDERFFRLPEGAFRSLGSLDFPLTICRDGRILNGHQQYRYYRQHGIKDFTLRVLPALPDEELWAVALDLTARRHVHTARPSWSYTAGNGYQVEVFPQLTGDGHLRHEACEGARAGPSPARRRSRWWKQRSRGQSGWTESEGSWPGSRTGHRGSR
jgi:hypothetical protein